MRPWFCYALPVVASKSPLRNGLSTGRSEHDCCVVHRWFLVYATAVSSCSLWFSFSTGMILPRQCRTFSTQAYTQHGGLRPWGVSMLLAGWDESRGLQLYKTEPSGTFKKCDQHVYRVFFVSLWLAIVLSPCLDGICLICTAVFCVRLTGRCEIGI